MVKVNMISNIITISLALLITFPGITLSQTSIRCELKEGNKWKFWLANAHGVPGWYDISPALIPLIELPSNAKHGTEYVVVYSHEKHKWVYHNGDDAPEVIGISTTTTDNAGSSSSTVDYNGLSSTKITISGLSLNGCSTDLSGITELPKGQLCSSGAELYKALDLLRKNPIFLAKYIIKHVCLTGDSAGDNGSKGYNDAVNYLVNLAQSNPNLALKNIPNQKFVDKAAEKVLKLTVNAAKSSGTVEVKHNWADESGKTRGAEERLLDFGQKIQGESQKLRENIAYKKGGNTCLGFISELVVDHASDGKLHRLSLVADDWTAVGTAIADHSQYAVVLFTKGYQAKSDDSGDN